MTLNEKQMWGFGEGFDNLIL